MCIQGFYFNNSNLCFIYFKSLLPAVKFLTNYCLSFLYVGNLKNEKEVFQSCNHGCHRRHRESEHGHVGTGFRTLRLRYCFSM